MYIGVGSSKQGFTLVELSIVLVIIGLIVAGVVAGQTIVSQARIRAVITDFNKYAAAVNTFKLTYSAWPGDMDNAYDYGEVIAIPAQLTAMAMVMALWIMVAIMPEK